MDDREIAMILRKRNIAYVKHLNEIQPHIESHDKLEGGFLSAIASAARIAAKMAIRAAKAGAKIAAKAAKSAGRTASRAAKIAAKAAKKAAKSKHLDKLDKAMTVADVAQAGYSIAQNLMKKKAAGETISDEEFAKLTAGQAIEIDFQRWARGLDKAEYDVFKQRGGDKSAAMQLARLMDAGMDPNDWVGNELHAIIDTTVDQLQDALDFDPNDIDECEDELDKDDRSEAEINGLIALSIIDMGIGEAISEAQLEKRQHARRNACIDRKKAENDRLITKLKKEIGVDPDDPNFDIDNVGDDLNVQAHVLGKMVAQNPNVEKAINLDGPRTMAGLPPVDKNGEVFKSEDSKYNDDLEKMALWFINNNTLDYDTYPDQGWIAGRIRYDQNFISRAIAKMEYYENFCSADPDIRFTKEQLVSEFTPLTPQQKWFEGELNRNPDWFSDFQAQEGWTVHYNPKKDGSGNMLRDENSRFYKSNDGTDEYPNRGNVPPTSPSIWWQYPDTDTYQRKSANKEGIKMQQRLETLLKTEKETFDAAKELVSTFDEKTEAQSAKDPFVPNKAYAVNDLMRYDNKAYKCKEAHTSGDKPDFTKWDELTLYDAEDLDYLKNIGAATPYLDYQKYPVDVFVKYQDRIFKKIKESEAGVLPTELEYWDEILLKDGDLINLQTDPGRHWKRDTSYPQGTKVFYDKDQETYIAITNVGNNIEPDNPDYAKQYWKRLITFNIDEGLATQLIQEQRLALFASVVQSAEDYDAAESYQLHDIVYAFDGKYYELIKEKKDKDGDIVPPPIPPNTTYWKVVSKGITVWDPKETYNINDFVQYTDGENYLCIQNTTAGILPTDKSFWQPLDEQFELLDENAIAANKQNFENAVMERADEFQDDPTSSYSEGEIVKVNDEDGYPQFYMCIKDIPFGRADGDDLRKAKPFDGGKRYINGEIISFEGVIYEMIAQNLGQGFTPTGYPAMWKPLGYEKDPGPPNPEFWKDYSAIDAEEEKNNTIRKNAKNGLPDLKGIKVGDVIVDPKTGIYYKLVGKDAYAKYTNTFEMRELPDFDNKTKPNTYDYRGNLYWEPQDIPTELEAKIANIEAKTLWRNDKLYKRDDLVTDQYKFKYLVVKDTPYAPMAPRLNPDYFIMLSDEDWNDAIGEIQQGYEKTAEVAQSHEAIRYNELDLSRKYKWEEIVFYGDKFYKFLAYGQDKNNNSPEVPRQRIPGKLTYDNVIEWIPCTESGDRLIIKDTDYPGRDLMNNVNIYMYMRGGPIIQVGDKYYVFNSCYKEIFGLGGPDDIFTSDWYGFWGSLNYKQGPEDTMTTEVFSDGKPKFKHDATTGNIIGENVDTSKLPKAQATVITDAVDKAENKTTCPTAEDDDGDDGDEEDDTHHEQVQADKDLEQAKIEAKAKGEEDPALVQGQTTTPSVGTAAGYNIEELDGSQYHQKKKRVYKRKNKSNM